MAKQDMNLGLTGNKPERGRPVYVEMDNTVEFERLFRLLMNGANSFALRNSGTEDLLESEFVRIMMVPADRQELIKKYELILENFKEGTEFFPDVYETVQVGDVVDSRKTRIGRYFGGWQRRNGITTRYESNDGMKELAKQGRIPFRINIVGDRYSRFLSSVQVMLAITKKIDADLSQIEKTVDIFSLPAAQKEYINRELGAFLNMNSPMVNYFPFKDVNGKRVYVDTSIFKGDLMDLLRTPGLAFLCESLSNGNFRDKFFTVEVLRYIVDMIVGEKNYIMLLSDPIAIEEEKVGNKMYMRYMLRSIYMDLLGNIGYAQVEASSQYGSEPEQQQRSVAGLVMRQAFIMAFPAFKSLKLGKGIDNEYELYKDSYARKRDNVFLSGNYAITDEKRGVLRLEPLKPGENYKDEYNLGVVSDLLFMGDADKGPKKPLLLESKQDKKLAKPEGMQLEKEEEEREVDNDPQVVRMEEEKKEEEKKEEKE